MVHATEPFACRRRLSGMRRRETDRMKFLVLCLVMVATAGCSQAGTKSAADCAAQIRVAGVVYTSYGTTNRQAMRHVAADEAQCHDVGPNADGSVFADNPDQVRTWTFESYSPADVLGVKYDKDGFGVFIADNVPVDERERIYADLSDAAS